MQTLRKFVAHRMGIALLAVAFCLAPLRVNAKLHRTAHPAVHNSKSHSGTSASHKSAKPTKPSLRNASYKTATHKKRRRRIRRHRVTLPKQPAADRTEEIQSALERRGYYAGDPSYKWDSKTQDALRRFQAANGLPATGKLDALSLQKLGLGSDVAGVGAPRPATTDEKPPAPPSNQPPVPPAPKTPGTR